MRTLKYYGMYLLSLILALAPIGGMLFSAYRILTSKNFSDFPKLIKTDSFQTNALIFVGSLIFLVATSKIVKKLKLKAQHGIDFSSGGKSKKYGEYGDLTRAEQKELEKRRLEQMEQIINSNEIRGKIHKGSDNPSRDLDKLIGLSAVKEEVSLMSARMKYNRRNMNMNTMHMCFVGPPGTGKTTVARIMTGYLYKNGYIKKNNCLEIDGNYLKIGGYASLRTERIVEFAEGGVLFIDEAYALCTGDVQQGMEALATLVKLMEDKRGSFLVIFAGYMDEMKTFVNINSGLYSRIKQFLHFDSYKPEELSEIFESMATEKGFLLGEGMKEAFIERITPELEKTTFGNARTVRTLLDKIMDRHYLNFERKVISDKKTLMPADIPEATWDEDYFDMS